MGDAGDSLVNCGGACMGNMGHISCRGTDDMSNEASESDDEGQGPAPATP